MNSETPQLAVSRVFDAPWLEAFEKLDTTLHHLQAVAADVEL